MGFVRLSDGGMVWTEPAEADIADVKDRLVNPGAHESPLTLPSSIQGQLVRMVNEQVAGIQQRAKANESFLSAVSSAIAEGQGPVDIILPVFNSLRIVKDCLDAVLKRTDWPYNLIIVDDASDSKTERYLREFAGTHDHVTVLRNTKNRGFAASINRGMISGKGKYVCLLNSDVLVTPRWLTKMVCALHADPKNQIVNPMTNNTAEIAVPMLQGANYQDMNRAFEATTARRYPEILPTGFCFMFRRSLIEEIGLFDEGYVSYGEESDFHMRAVHRIKDGIFVNYKAVMADDTYLFHERGSSFSQLGADKHMDRRKESNARFKRLWPGFASWAKAWNVGKTIGTLRQPMPPAFLHPPNSLYNVAFVVHTTSYCGGMRYIADIVNELNERGIDAKVIQILRPTDKADIPLSELRSAPVVYATAEDFYNRFPTEVFKVGIIVAATAELVPFVKEVCDKHPDDYTGLLFSQSYDPDLSPTPEIREQMCENITKLPFAITAAKWLEEIYKEANVNVLGSVVPGVDLDTFYPRGRENGDERPTVMVSLGDQNVPWRGYKRGTALIRALWNLAQNEGKEIRILALGPEVVPDAPVAVGLGPLSQPRLAAILGTEVDVLVDPSRIHSYGLPFAEAMASGVVPVVWDYKGQEEIVGPGFDVPGAIVMPDNTSVDEAAKKILDLLFRTEKHLRLAGQGMQLILNHDRRKSVNDFIALLERGLCLKMPKKRIVIITPHMRKYGGPTTIIQTANLLAARGHDVSLATVYTDIAPEVLATCKIPVVVDYTNLPPCDVLITNSDNPYNDQFNTTTKAKKKILLKLSHNERFQKEENHSLELKWDAIVTSSKWLAEACETTIVDRGWTHPPHKATRVGWFHYGHEQFNCHPNNRLYGEATQPRPIVIGTLIHHHPLKGSLIALEAIAKFKEIYGNKVHVIGFGEVADYQPPPWMQYLLCASREQMASAMMQTDIWVGASLTEGLGRMALEAMSSGVACVLSDTGAEFASDNNNCLLFAPGDPTALFEKIDLLFNTPALAKKIREAGYKTACEAASPKQYVQNLERVLQEVFENE